MSFETPPVDDDQEINTERPESPDGQEINTLLSEANVDDRSSSDDEINNEATERDLVHDLGVFFNEHTLTHRAVKQLTTILREHNANWRDLPLDLRTYVSRSSGNQSFEIETDKFVYIGVKYQLENRKLPETGPIRIQLSTDGFPLGKSTPIEVWPVLMATENQPNLISVICVYIHSKKPTTDELLAKLVLELSDLIENGVHGRKVSNCQLIKNLHKYFLHRL